jgi:hypothetical protein
VATYRFLDNDKIDFPTVLSPQIEGPYYRVEQQQVVLLVQDTTESDLTGPHPEVAGVGPLPNGNRCDVLPHLMHAFTTDGTPLGTVAAEAWTREPKHDKPIRLGSSEKRVQTKRTPFEEKATYRWLTTAGHCHEVKSHLPQDAAYHPG